MSSQRQMRRQRQAKQSEPQNISVIVDGAAKVIPNPKFKDEVNDDTKQPTA